jgi:hypothetical protein
VLPLKRAFLFLGVSQCACFFLQLVNLGFDVETTEFPAIRNKSAPARRREIQDARGTCKERRKAGIREREETAALARISHGE